jgi:beta-N-acetylhexosaminidase
MLPCILGLSGRELTGDERAFFGAAAPAGYILFGRNVRDKAQLRALTDELRSLAGRDDLLILIDQEGGRIARLGPPIWPAFPPQAVFGELYRRAPMSAMEAARANAQAIGLVLAEAGINVNCMPLLDLRHDGAHGVIGKRSLGRDAMQVAALGRMVLEGLAAAGVAGIVKHMPGHGRAEADSHKELPVVHASAQELEEDLAPFHRLRNAAIGMTAHVLYPAWDPDRCATLSPTVIEEVIRSRIGFDGLLISDDIAMEALKGSLAERAKSALEAGCDLVLHCSGKLADGGEIAGAIGEMSDLAKARLSRASARPRQSSLDLDSLLAKRDALLSVLTA